MILLLSTYDAVNCCKIRLYKKRRLFLLSAIQNKLADHRTRGVQSFCDHSGSAGKSCPIRKLFTEMRRFLVPPSLMREKGGSETQTVDSHALSLTHLLSSFPSVTFLHVRSTCSFNWICTAKHDTYFTRKEHNQINLGPWLLMCVTLHLDLRLFSVSCDPAPSTPSFLLSWD